MKTNESVFFREATLRLSGSLEIENALWQLVLYLREHMPANQVALNLYNHETGIGEIVVRATAEEGKLLAIKMQMPEVFRTRMIKQRPKEIRTIKRMGAYEGTKEAARIMGVEDQSCLLMDLVVEGTFLGMFSVICEKGKQFSDEHIRLLKPLNRPLALALTNCIQFLELKRIKDWLADESRYFQEELRQLTGETVIGAGTGLKRTMKMVQQVAPLNSPVLLLGETGVGKELIAGAIHYSSTRANHPIIKVNCGAIPESLMDSELFGHEKGAFTGATSRKYGRFERSHGGTIFLDEVAELSLNAQVRLLRVLQEKEIERVGGTETLHVDIRLIAATNRDIAAMVKEGTFREDLFFRLNVFPLKIPPLRDRIEDIPKLIDHFINKKALEMKKIEIPNLAPGVIDRLMEYNWPGNVRELENTVERALILNEGSSLAFEEIESKQPQLIEQPVTSNQDSLNLDELLYHHYQKALAAANGKVEGKGGAAELLGINPRTLRYRMRKLGVPFGRSL